MQRAHGSVDCRTRAPCRSARPGRRCGGNEQERPVCIQTRNKSLTNHGRSDARAFDPPRYNQDKIANV
jgi:hypothetical protein